VIRSAQQYICIAGSTLPGPLSLFVAADADCTKAMLCLCRVVETDADTAGNHGNYSLYRYKQQ